MRPGAPRKVAHARHRLVIAHLTISLVLLVGAGLFLHSFQQVQSVDPGFGREPTAIMTFLTPATRFTPDEARAYTRRLLDRLRELPGVETVGAISNLHLNPLSTQSIEVADRRGADVRRPRAGGARADGRGPRGRPPTCGSSRRRRWTATSR